jgi:hypothetical protein
MSEHDQRQRERVEFGRLSPWLDGPALITDDDKARWREALRVEIAAKRFLGGQVHLFVWGTRASS